MVLQMPKGLLRIRFQPAENIKSMDPSKSHLKEHMKLKIKKDKLLGPNISL
jgi:hypothetical protein